MSLISIITDQSGQIISSKNSSKPLTELMQPILNLKFDKKVLFANILDNNYIVCRLQLNILDSTFNQYIFDEWRFCGLTDNKNTETFKTRKKFEYNSFNSFEKEVIFALLNGYSTNKEIEYFLKNNYGLPIKGNIQHIISMLFLRFNCDNRACLIKMLKMNSLDKYLPSSLFPPGIYDLSDNNKKLSNKFVVVF